MPGPEKPTTAAPISTTGPSETAGDPGIAAPAEIFSSSEKQTPTRESYIQQLWASAKLHDHGEIWGVELADPGTHIPSQVVFQKYLNANDGDLNKAKDQLTKTLDWRKDTKPLQLEKETFSSSKFAGLGYVTTYGDVSTNAMPEERAVFTWNIYGIVKDINNTFGELKEFLQWRTALMELAIASLNLPSATVPITAEHDPYKIYQVHDYRSISFFRQSSQVKSASTETIKVFAQNYPELLKEKFFVNVPAVMGFVYGLMKLFVAPKTIKKFHPMSNGGALSKEFGESKIKGLGEMLPPEYGGKGKNLDVQGKKVQTE